MDASVDTTDFLNPKGQSICFILYNLGLGFDSPNQSWDFYFEIEIDTGKIILNKFTVFTIIIICLE